jgi:DNA-binding GntR family transcriptional regulator
VARLTKHLIAYQALKDRIVEGAFSPGYRIVIDSVARELGVSAVPVREAVRQLEAEGWLTYEPNVGARVSALQSGQREESVSALAVLLGLATALSAPSLQSPDLARACELSDAVRAAADEHDPLRCARLDDELHLALASRCDNESLLQLIRGAMDRVRAVRRFALPLPPRQELAEHDELLALIASAANAAEIEALARRHQLRLLEALRRVLRVEESLSQPRAGWS